jgi:subtilase family serine protease
MTRHILRLAAVAFVAPLVAACGGGGSHAVPGVPSNAVPVNPPISGSAVLRGTMVAVHLPLRNVQELDALIAASSDRNSPQFGHFLTPQQFRASYAPAAADVAAAQASLKSMGFQTQATGQNVFASAPQAVVERAFGVKISPADGKRASMTVDRAPRVPDALAKLGATVTVKNFVYQPHSMLAGPSGNPTEFTDNRYGPDGPYWFTDLKEAYGYPTWSAFHGNGRTIGIVMATDAQDSDITSYFTHENYQNFAPIPTIEHVKVNGGAPFGGIGNGASVEASLDAQQSLGSAPGAHVIMYSLPDLSQDNILAAYDQIVSENRADIVTSSFGLCELYYTAAYNGGTDFTFYMDAFHDAFKQGNAQGITFVASSGDHGSYECADVANTMKIQQGVSNPANDPNVTAVGGTNLVTTIVPPNTTTTPYQYTSKYVSENAYDDQFQPAASGYPNDIWGSGGGISTYYSKPAYQYLVNTRNNSQRTIPDISMHMGGCPFGAVTPCGPDRSADIVRINNRNYGVIGTSASSPEFAGLLAVTEQSLGGVRLGNANFLIYAEAFAFRNNVFRHPPGNNGYPTHADYDYVVGNGTPKATNFMLHPGTPQAGDPMTATNP